MASWKIIPDPSEDSKIEYTTFLHCRKFFAVDDSGSTAGAILQRERTFVERLHDAYANPANAVSLWGSHCDTPTQKFEAVNWRSGHGGTQPSTILQNSAALATIKGSDMWFLLTDGEIWDGDVHRLADLASQHDVLNVPLVFVITGGRGKTPSTTNISVGISFFASAQDTLILFKETGTGKIYVIAGKGCFQVLVGSEAAQDLESWTDMPVFDDEMAFFNHCKAIDLHVVAAESRRGGFTKGVSLGTEWEAREGDRVQVDLDLLPRAGLLSDEDLFSVLADDAFDTLAVAYKTRSRIPELRGFVQGQKVEQVAPKLEDVAGAANILAKLSSEDLSEEQRKELQQQLREAHVKNREHYQSVIADFAGSEKERNIKRRNQLVDAALRSLASIEAAGFSAEILSRKSNRARRAGTVDSAPIDMAKLDLDAPSCKGFCLVCCGDDEVMSICFKEPEPDNTEDNTTDFALNFPLAAGAAAKNVDLISSQNICFQCASLMSDGRSIYQEELKAVIPAVQYAGSNKKYINDQLYLALTAGLATGAAGIAQLFLAILGGVLRTKSWAGGLMDDAEVAADEQHEAIQRRRTFQWMLEQVVQNTFTREDFKETGAWVKFPQALEWVAKDFDTNGLASFAVTYPVAGFENLLALGQGTGAFSDELVGRMKSAKTVYSVAAKYLAELLKAATKRGSDIDEHWKQKYLELIYADFNGPLIPRDQGEASLVISAETFISRLSACLGQPSTLFNDEIEAVMRKIQLTTFWLLFTQRSHCTAQTFFTRLHQTDPLAASVLNPSLSVPDTEARRILLSIFIKSPRIDPAAATQHTCLIPFANPFGASVLHCGAESCNVSFCSLTHPEQVTGRSVNAIRDARRQHLINVFGLRGQFETSQTGLPDRPFTQEGKAPTSLHTNLHISIVREWAAASPAQRKLVVFDNDGGDAKEMFIRRVTARLCKEGRGNVFQSGLDGDTRVLLPSFFNILAKALTMAGRETEGVWEYEHDFDMNTLEGKVAWEMEAAAVAAAGSSIDDSEAGFVIV